MFCQQRISAPVSIVSLSVVQQSGLCSKQSTAVFRLENHKADVTCTLCWRWYIKFDNKCICLSSIETFAEIVDCTTSSANNYLILWPPIPVLSHICCFRVFTHVKFCVLHRSQLPSITF